MKASVAQIDSFGCGVACVAFATKRSYHKVAMMLGKTKAKETGFFCRELIKVITELGLSYDYRYVKSHNHRLIYREGSIVFLKRSKLYPFGHYIIRHKDMWMDPWLNFAINKEVKYAQSGYRKRLSGTPQYVLYKTSLNRLQK